MLALGATLHSPYDSESTFHKLAQIAPLKRNSNLAEVCEAVDYLLTASPVTGQVLSLANGFNLASARHS